MKLSLSEICAAGLIIPCKTGVFWSNQVGGTACSHPSLEGLFYPLPAGWVQENDPIYDYLDADYKTRGQELVNKVLNGYPSLQQAFEVPTPEEVAAAGLSCVGEAWVPVKIKKVGHTPDYSICYELLKNFGGQVAVLTYENSD